MRTPMARREALPPEATSAPRYVDHSFAACLEERSGTRKNCTGPPWSAAGRLVSEQRNGQLNYTGRHQGDRDGGVLE
jgi:hypothetical protein